MKVDELIQALEQNLLPLYDANRAKGMMAYMKNHFHFLGIQKPIRAASQKEWLIQSKVWDIALVHDIVKNLWNRDEREYQYVAMDLLMQNRKKWNDDTARLFEYMVVEKSWWDTVDLIASRMFGLFWKNNHEQHIPTIMKYATSNNIWLNRVAIIHQLSYKQQTNATLLTDVILLTREKKEFFIQKAIGWSLRQYSYTNPIFVMNFVEKYTLSNLATREALKAIKRKAESSSIII
jgi:3-methyladenine DNA glycosylase AlkD